MKPNWIKAMARQSVTWGAQPPEQIRWGFHESPLGMLGIGLTNHDTIALIIFSGAKADHKKLATWQKRWRKTVFIQDEKATASIAKRIFDGKADLRLQAVGTAFQLSIWKQLLKIPTGKVISYAEMAKRIANPKAVRAVGTACGANPLPILIPCHRVIATGGGLGGFGGGLPLKKEMLRAEGLLLE